MQLSLKFPPTPEAAPSHAALVADSALEISGVRLDYSIPSLAAVDTIIEEWHSEHVAVDDVAATLFAFGCYVGEVFVRNAGARWVSANGTAMQDIAGFFIILDLGSRGLVNPIGKVFKRLELGSSENLPYFYQVFAGTPAPHPTPRAPSLFKRLFGRGRAGTA